METFDKMTNNDLIVSEKIQLLLKEHGITIISVLTAIGAIIATLVEGLTGGSTGGTIVAIIAALVEGLTGGWAGGATSGGPEPPGNGGQRMGTG